MKIVVGTDQLSSGGRNCYVDDIIVHEKYMKPDLLNDIALLRTKLPIQFNDRVQPIVYTREEVSPGETLQATGWGRLSVCVCFKYHYRIIISIRSRHPIQ